MAGVLGITLKHATTKHAQAIGLLERSHASIKQALKIETRRRRSLWHKYVSFAVLNYNTSYHTSIGCEPSRVFHGRIPYISLGLNLGIHSQQALGPNSQSAQDVIDQNRNDPPRCSQKCYASLYQTKSLLRQKGQRLKAERCRLCICLTAESGSLGE